LHKSFSALSASNHFSEGGLHLSVLNISLDPFAPNNLGGGGGGTTGSINSQSTEADVSWASNFMSSGFKGLHLQSISPTSVLFLPYPFSPLPFDPLTSCAFSLSLTLSPLTHSHLHFPRNQIYYDSNIL